MVEVLGRAGLDVRRVFTPEHGRAGRAAAGEKVPDGVDPETRLPLVSLYGAKTRPAPEDLAGLEALVIDLQDAGVRFYTYVAHACSSVWRQRPRRGSRWSCSTGPTRWAGSAWRARAAIRPSRAPGAC